MRPRTLADLAGDCRPSGSQLVYRDCPECRDRRWKFSVDPGTGLYHCFRCGFAGRLEVPATMSELRARLNTRASVREGWGPAALPEHHDLSYEANMFLWNKYGISLEMAKTFGLVEGSNCPECAYGRRVLIPYHDRIGEVVYYSGRSYVGAEPKYLNMPGRHPLYVLEYPCSDRMVLVEGAFDAMKVHLAGFDVVGLGGKALARYLLPDLLALRARSYVVALDGDALGAALRLKSQLSAYADEVRVARLPEGEDPGSMSIEALREALK